MIYRIGLYNEEGELIVYQVKAESFETAKIKFVDRMLPLFNDKDFDDVRDIITNSGYDVITDIDIINVD